MKVTVNTALNRVFTPEWNGNKELPPGEQVTVSYKAPTIAMKERLFERKFDFTKSTSGDGMDAGMSVIVDRKKVINELTTAINGLVVDVDGKDIKIATTAQLFEAGVELDGLVEELYTFYNDLINQKGVEEKN